MREEHRDRLKKVAAGAAPLNRLLERADRRFDEQRAFYSDPAQLVAALCSRRSGKTSEGCPALLEEAMATPGFRGLYVNETRAEVKRLAWVGGRGDGCYSLNVSLGLGFDTNETELTMRYIRDPKQPALDSWIYFVGADDEAGIRKALGVPYHLVWWDEAQKIPPKLSATIMETLLPSLLDFGGRLRLTGTPTRQMAGLFYDVTRPGSKLRNWSVHRWNLLRNPHFGRAKAIGDEWYVVWSPRNRDIVMSGPHPAGEELERAVSDARMTNGVLALQKELGGPEVCPLDSPILQREAFGVWVHEDALYVYRAHGVPGHVLYYAPHRTHAQVINVRRLESDTVIRVDEIVLPNFPDLAAALRDLPGYLDGREYHVAVGSDIGYDPDPFGVVAVAWSLVDPVLYEVASYGVKRLDSDEQASVLRHFQETLGVGKIAADAGGPAKPTVAGWSATWVSRYGIPIEEVPKANKATAQNDVNVDLARGLFRLRGTADKPGPLASEFLTVQFSSVRTSTGRLIEDPTIPNDIADAGLYAHRISYAHRHRDEAPPPPPGSDAWWAAQEAKALEELDDPESRLTFAVHPADRDWWDN